jgi:hypothetical protein
MAQPHLDDKKRQKAATNLSQFGAFEHGKLSQFAATQHGNLPAFAAF